MKATFHDRLLRRELGETSRYASIKGLYGDRSWVDELDIVNELGGHKGCVNALSWSSSGELLASGSDDLHLNIHRYQPESSTSQFSFKYSLLTGHTANIFSAKFIPHTGDRTVVTCAGDCEVRVFDIEKSGPSSIPSSSSASQPGFNSTFNGMQYLTTGGTNCRVYRSHSDRVKRIVTESSPFLFLTCSEDGEVRQFDLRLPSSAYPSPRGGRRFHARSGSYDDSSVPPPLISYKRHHLDLNTISCSATQPHYIALGGAHLHCFLHDRRYIGRDRFSERGDPGNISSPDNMSPLENELMGQATQCVRRFAPNGRSRMRRTDNGHITACKISDSNPDSLIASWSGDHIYSFDLIRSPDVDSSEGNSTREAQYEELSGKMKESRDRKRKRKPTNTSGSSERHGKSANLRLNQGQTNEPEDLALRVHYENGQSEDISMGGSIDAISGAVLESAKESILTESQRRSLRIAQSVVRIRKMLFSLDAAIRTSHRDRLHDPSVYGSIFASVLDSATVLSEMNEVSRSWRYPVDPLEDEIVVQQTLRTHRDSARRFVQAAGNLAKVLGGKAPTAENGSTLFQIGPVLHEGPKTPQDQIFSFDFLKAILLWLDGGPKALLEGFQRPPNHRMGDPRFPIPDAADHSAIDRHLVPYLLRLVKGSSRSIPNVDASRFETDERRHIFDSETGAVNAFGMVVRASIEELPPADLPPVQDTPSIIQDKMAAVRFWGFRVARGVLMNAGIGINFQYVDIAFGGVGTSRVDEGRIQDEIDIHENEEVIESASHTSVISPRAPDLDEQTAPAGSDPGSRESSVDFEDAGSDAEMILMDDLHDEIAEHVAEHDEHDGIRDEDGEDEDDEDDESNAEDSDGDITAEERQFIFRSAADRGKSRELVDADVPYASHTRKYQGHCNVKTVKDCNFYGLHDDYVVSGSDDGNLFIWDKLSGELVNILEGDGEVVNVVQGHPFEPVLAVSGIDSTVKIFSPDSRAQEDARLGNNIGSGSDGFSTHSSLRSLSGRRRSRRTDSGGPNGEAPGLASRKRMDRMEQITSENDVQRQGGMREAFITRGMLAQIAAQLRARQAGGRRGGGGGDGTGDGGADEGFGPIIIDDNCVTM